jgi:hypothetical protein
MAATARPGDDDAARALYAPETTRRVYERLAALARGLLEAGSSVVVDATCNTRSQRDLLAAVARDTGTRIVWLEIDLPVSLLHDRVAARAAEGHDPSDATSEILRAQLASREPIDEAELTPHAGGPPSLHLCIGAEELAAPARLLAPLAARLRSLSDTEQAT